MWITNLLDTCLINEDSHDILEVGGTELSACLFEFVVIIGLFLYFLPVMLLFVTSVFVACVVVTTYYLPELSNRNCPTGSYPSSTSTLFLSSSPSGYLL